MEQPRCPGLTVDQCALPPPGGGRPAGERPTQRPQAWGVEAPREDLAGWCLRNIRVSLPHIHVLQARPRCGGQPA